MRYADTLLSTGETVVLRQRQHWLALLIEAKTAVALWFLAIVLVVAGAFFRLTGTARDVLGWASVAAFVLGLVVFVYHAWRWWAQDYMVTNRRILKVEGILNKRAADSSLEKINDAVLEQNIVGRMLGYGDLDILTAADTSIDRYRMLNQAPRFKREMLNQKHALETEFAYRQPPTPPFRATPPTDLDAEPTRPDTIPAYAPPAAPPPPPPPPPPDVAPPAPEIHAAAPAAEQTSPDPAAITQTLARLADLRDRGAITPEEYEAKKDELLSRL